MKKMSKGKTNKGLVEYAKAQLGRPYWYGTFGQIGTKALYLEKKRQYPNMYEKWSEQSFMDQIGQKVHDCVGLIKGYIMSEGANDPAVYNRAYDVSANGLIGLCKETGSIDKIPEVPGLIVWKESHVGVYIGGGYVVEAKGHSYGVVKTKLTSRPWVKWGRLPSIWITYEEEPTKQWCRPVIRVLRKGDHDYAVKVLQNCLNLKGYSLSVDGAYGNKTAEAVRDFQTKNDITPLETVGVLTWNALFK